jgi:outer membrane protein TolC
VSLRRISPFLAVLLLSAAAQGEPTSIPVLSFDDAVARTLAKNPTVAIAEQETKRALALVEQVRAASLPTLSATAEGVFLDAPRTEPPSVPVAPGGTNLAEPQNQVVLGATATIPLVIPAAWVKWAHSRDNVNVARRSEADVRRQLAVAVAKTYLSLVAQHRVVDLTKRAMVTAKAHYDYAHSRFVGAFGSRLDEVRAAQEVSSDATQLEVAQSALYALQEALGVLLGDERPFDADPETQLLPSPTMGDALQTAPVLRTDILLAKERLYAAKHVARDDWADYVPYLIATGMPFYANPPMSTLPTTGWQVQVLLTWPVYDGGLRYGQAHERATLVAEAQLTLEGNLRQANSDVRASTVALDHADTALVSAKDAAAKAQEALKLTTLAYKAGASTDIEVIDAERVALDADTAAAVAEDNVRESHLDVLVASGRFPASAQ